MDWEHVVQLFQMFRDACDVMRDSSKHKEGLGQHTRLAVLVNMSYRSCLPYGMAAS